MTALVEEAVAVGDLVRLFTFRQGQANLVELTLPEDSPYVGTPSGLVPFPDNCALVTILRDGRWISTTPRAELTPALAIRGMVWRKVVELFKRERREPGAVRLAVRDLKREGVFQGVNFELRAGEVLGFAGLVGAHRTDVGLALFGIAPADGGTIELDGRKIAVRARCKGMAWFDFAELCEGPRGAADYIEIAREFHTVLLGGAPRMDERADNPARRFITLIDELYDRHVNLVCTADAAPPQPPRHLPPARPPPPAPAPLAQAGAPGADLLEPQSGGPDRLVHVPDLARRRPGDVPP